MEVIRRLQEIRNNSKEQNDLFSSDMYAPVSKIRLSQFYGIELDDFAHESAILSLWLAEHQMNMEFKAEFGDSTPTLPLKASGNITRGNAATLDWSEICRNTENETVVVGNPPYKGSRVQSLEQKKDMESSFVGIKNHKDIDYVGCWLMKASRYINDRTSVAFVTTSSICEGSQVTALWPHIFENNNEISFAYKSFHWSNNAKRNAGVTCSIIGLREKSNLPAYLYLNNLKQKVNNINAYLIAGANIFVHKEKKPLTDIPIMLAGNYTGHAQALMLSTEEKLDLLEKHSEAKPFFKRVLGSNELIKGIERWCLWISDTQRENAESIHEIKNRIARVFDARTASIDKSANRLADRPHQFRDLNETKTQSIVVPTVSSERREYLPISFINQETIVTNKAMVLYDCEAFIFGILVSKMHMAWVKAIAGRMRKDISYSSILCYNTFPVPDINDTQKETITELVFKIIEVREQYPSRTLAELYDPTKMPDDLRKAHLANDNYIDSLYSEATNLNDDIRLQILFKKYEKMTGGQNA